MNKIELNYDKSLKLTNAVTVEIDTQQDENLALVADKLDNYIKAKGYMPVGPLIQYCGIKDDRENGAEVVMKFIRQSSQFINHTDEPYSCSSFLRVKNCMYARYIGPEESFHFAYDKINLAAFEDNIKLIGDSYTIYVNETADDVIIDVFMEKMADE